MCDCEITPEEAARRKQEALAEDYRNRNRFVYIGPGGWPVSGIINRPVVSFIRRLLWTRKIVRYKTWLKNGHMRIGFGD